MKMTGFPWMWRKRRKVSNAVLKVEMEGTGNKSSLAFEKTDFLLGMAIDVVVSKDTTLFRGRGLQLTCDISDEVKETSVFGDRIRFQQVLAGFLLSMVRPAITLNGVLKLQVNLSQDQNFDLEEVVVLRFRIICRGESLPCELVRDIFDNSLWMTEDLNLSTCRKILFFMMGWSTLL